MERSVRKSATGAKCKMARKHSGACGLRNIRGVHAWGQTEVGGTGGRRRTEGGERAGEAGRARGG
eukprot:2752715-Prorocentrum_lima.AAC.1